jgi:hypothetical protein
VSEYQYYEFLALDRPLTTAEQADAVVDAVQDSLERPFAGQHMAADGYVEHVLGCHWFLLVILLFLSPARSVGEQGSESVGLRWLLRRCG